MQYNKFWVGWGFGCGLIFLTMGNTVLGLFLVGMGLMEARLEYKKEQKEDK
jgi:4-amino-4-deoxy-L-arabinose transferase-like glycosyltransferase